MLNRLLKFLSAGMLLTAAAGAATLDEGIRQYRHGRFAEAEATMRQVCEAEPDNPAAFERLALSLAALKNPEEARAQLALGVEKGLAEDRALAAEAKLALERRDLEAASEKISQALELNPDNADALDVRGRVRIANKDFAGAAEDFDRALELDPDRPYTHFYSGIAYNGLKRPDKMVERLHTFLRLAPDAPDSDKVRSLLRAFR